MVFGTKSLALLVKIKFLKITTKKKFILINTSGVAKVYRFFFNYKKFSFVAFYYCCNCTTFIKYTIFSKHNFPHLKSESDVTHVALVRTRLARHCVEL